MIRSRKQINDLLISAMLERESGSDEYPIDIERLLRSEVRVDVDQLELWRAAEQSPTRARMLAEVRAGERTELVVPIIATTERDTPRPLPVSQAKHAAPNFTRFHLPEFAAFASSFVGQPFLRDHSTRTTDRGGAIETSEAKSRGKNYRIVQTVRLVKPWAMEDALDGSMRSFSIGWQPRLRGLDGLIASAFCTVCDGPMFGPDSRCDHFPGQTVKVGSPAKRFIVELEWRDVVGRETSEVLFPAAAGTGIDGALRELVEPALEVRQSTPRSEPVDPEILAALNLREGASTAEIATAITKLKADAEALENERSLREVAEEDAARHRTGAESLAERLAQIEADRLATMRSEALDAGLFVEGSKRASLFDKTAKRSLTEAAELVETWHDDPQVPTVGGRQLPGSVEPPKLRGVAGGFSVDPMSGGMRVEPGEDAGDKWVRGSTGWLLQKAGLRRAVEKANKLRDDDLLDFDFGQSPVRGMTCIEIARLCLERGQVSHTGLDKFEVFGRSFTERGVYGAAAVGDFPVLLENLLHKTLLAFYAITPDTWRVFCATGSVSDFRPHNRYRMGSFASLDIVGEGGEFTNKAIPDSRKESISAQTRGNIIAITRQALINDDLGAFTRLAQMFGRAARRSIEIDVYATLALNGGLGPLMNDGNTLFHASHNNIGAGAALSGTAIDADRVLMAQQTDEDGNDYLDMRPDILLLPIGLGSLARAINTAVYEIDDISGTTEQNKFMKPNTVNGLFRDIVDTPRLSGTRRYLFADPDITPTLEVAFLDGQEEPFLELQQGWRVDGSEWKVRLDYGVAGVDYRGAVTDAGV